MPPIIQRILSMLEKGKIPAKEPLLRVGIVLPEDRQDEISIELPAASHVQLDGQTLTMEQDSLLNVVMRDGGLACSLGERTFTGKSLAIAHAEKAFLIRPVIAGRGFHWAKHIDVNLPDKIEISVTDGHLLVVNELTLEKYLACVATSEMSAACPPSFLEAQTIVARSWMLANIEQKHVNLGFDVCNDDCCQRYQGINNLSAESEKAAADTSGQVLMYAGSICDARYSKNCGGIMERFENLWENTPLPYMKSISDSAEPIIRDLTNEDEAREWILSSPDCFCGPTHIPQTDLKKYLGHVDEAGEYFRWTVKITEEDLRANLKDKAIPDIAKVVDLKTLKRGGSGRLLELGITYETEGGDTKEMTVIKDYEARRLLHPSFLFSSAVIIEKETDPVSGQPAGFVYRGAGWGHGSGLCQMGGLGMGLDGYSSEEIVLHYYPGSHLEKIY